MSNEVVPSRISSMTRGLLSDPGVQHAAAGALVALGVAVVKQVVFHRGEP